MSNDIRLDLLLKEINDVYVQENFRKLKRYIDNLESRLGSGGGDTINNINNTVITSPWSQIVSVELPVAATTVVHTIAVGSTTCGEYIVCLEEQGGSATKSFKLRYRKTDTDVEDQIYSKSGSMNVNADIVRTLTTIELRLTNNEPYIVDANFSTINT